MLAIFGSDLEHIQSTMEPIQVVAVTALVIFIFYKYGTGTYNYWKALGVKAVVPPFPFLGNFYHVFLNTEDAISGSRKFYDSFPGEKLVGIYLFRTPSLIIKDPELIKAVTVKDADYFINKLGIIKEEVDPVFGSNLLSLKDQKWRDMRNALSVVFTSAKIKNMFLFMNKCGQQVTEYLDEEILKQSKITPENKILDVEFKEFFTRYATDVIASTAFGIEVDSLRDSNNQFYKIGQKILHFTDGTIRLLKFMFMMFVPKLAKYLKMTLLGHDSNAFFQTIVRDSIQERQEKKIVRPDMIHALMEARQGKLVGENNEPIKGKIPDLTDDVIAAQAMLFFFAGFDTVTTVLGFTAYELAVNPEIQEKLQKEIDEIVDTQGGINYENIMHKMKYLDMVVHESLRKWPALTIIDREVSQDYVFPATDTTLEIPVKRGDLVQICVGGLHYDPKYYPEPEKFIPERFSEENKLNLTPFTYFPFGVGPRHCIGMRFGLLEVKTVLVHLLRKYDIVPTSKTTIPIQLAKNSGMRMQTVGGYPLGLRPRVK